MSGCQPHADRSVATVPGPHALALLLGPAGDQHLVARAISDLLFNENSDSQLQKWKSRPRKAFFLRRRAESRSAKLAVSCETRFLAFRHKTRLAPSNEFRSSTDAAVQRCCQRGIAPSRTKLGAPASSHMTNLPLATWLRRRRSTRSAEAGRWRRRQRRRRRQRDGLAVGET